MTILVVCFGVVVVSIAVVIVLAWRAADDPCGCLLENTPPGCVGGGEPLATTTLGLSEYEACAMMRSGRNLLLRSPEGVIQEIMYEDPNRGDLHGMPPTPTCGIGASGRSGGDVVRVPCVECLGSGSVKLRQTPGAKTCPVCKGGVSGFIKLTKIDGHPLFLRPDDIQHFEHALNEKQELCTRVYLYGSGPAGTFFDVNEKASEVEWIIDQFNTPDEADEEEFDAAIVKIAMEWFDEENDDRAINYQYLSRMMKACNAKRDAESKGGAD